MGPVGPVGPVEGGPGPSDGPGPPCAALS